MCGIIAILHRSSQRPAPAADHVESPIEQALAFTFDPRARDLSATLTRAAEFIEAANRELFGPAGIESVATNEGLANRVRLSIRAIQTRLDECESVLDSEASRSASELEDINAAVVRLRDALWAVEHDRLDTADAVVALNGSSGRAGIEGCFAIQSALSAIDRLEVRGRDSAGLHVMVSGHELDLDDPTIRDEFAKRSTDAAFRSMSVRRLEDDTLSFVYKRAAEIGELGDNVAALRAAIAGDTLLHSALRSGTSRISVLGHTRWASIGIISESNAHPLNSEETEGSPSNYVIGALNGDVDNHAALVEQHALHIEPEITTDAKVIPTLVARRLDAGDPIGEAFRQTVQAFEGSVAIGITTAKDLDRQVFALRGSGQALYVGLAEDTFIVASEPYGVTELTNRYLRMDGETPGNPNNPTGSRGQIVTLDRNRAGTVEGIQRMAYDGTPLPVTEADLADAPVTTRDVDRGSYPHFLLKEITESPRSFRKTLRGRIQEVDGRLRVKLGDETLPERIRTRLRAGEIKRILVIGQGTAAVAGQGVLAAIDTALAASDIATFATPATELSGFQMRPDMSDTLIVAISQSGTTTDTNRTVDLVRARGAHVIAIVNRRGSDLTDKADGVLYTSDGRDVEMSVASTKAFYAQIAAGFLLAYALAHELGCVAPADEHAALTALREMPDAMRKVIGDREPVREAAVEFATSRRYWAVVGNGNNRIAAAEIRIKLSELCYKSIACDATEDKKHIDLSAEPLILVCAAGLRGSTADDVAKEVAIYAAHQSAPIVIASEGEDRFSAACRTITVPTVHAAIDFVLSAVVGHMFGYEAALAIDDLADPLRECRAAVERAARSGVAGEELLNSLAPSLATATEEFSTSLRSGALDGQLEARTATQLTSLLRYATGIAPLGTFQIEHGKVGTPEVVIEDLTTALTEAIEQLTRPVDAIKHQAKTVTVGISRSDETLLNENLVRAVLEGGAPKEALAYDELRALAALSPLVDNVLGFSRYRIDSRDGAESIEQVATGGIAKDMVSRTGENPQLKGTKHRVSRERQLLVARGQSDDRTVIIVPETDGKQTTGITLLHVSFVESAEATTLRSALTAYRDRWATLEETITETEASVRTDVLEGIPVLDCLVEPIPTLAQRWRKAKTT